LAKIFVSLKQVFILPNSLLLALSIFIMLTAFAFIRTLLPIFTIQALGWTNERYSQVYAVSSLVAGIAGMLLGGILLDGFGKIRMMQLYLLSAHLLTVLMVFLKIYWHNSFFTIGYITIFNFLFVFSAIGIFAVAMQFCWKRISAIQFTLYMTLVQFGQRSRCGGDRPDQEPFQLAIYHPGLFNNGNYPLAFVTIYEG
jgi:PAT family beta-lactamase induction signal transducer AmpG